MSAVLRWTGDDDALPVQGVASLPAHHRSSRSRARRSLPAEGQASDPAELPPEVEQALWRGCDLGLQAGRVLSSGFAALDAELPGGGWPCGALTEVLSAQPAVLEWRLVGPSLPAVVTSGRPVVVIGPPRSPHLPGLQHLGLDASQLVWIQAEAPAQRLWCCEQLIKSGACGALLAWLPQARPEQIRRLQVAAQGLEAPVFLFRPEAARHESSAAPLRALAGFDLDWTLQVQLLKRRGPVHDGVLALESIPGGLASVLTPRTRHPGRWLPAREAVPVATTPGAAVHVLGRPASAPIARTARSAAAQR